jgi:hypothetical protein
VRVFAPLTPVPAELPFGTFLQKARLLVRKNHRGTMWHAGCNEPIFLVFSLGVGGRDNVSTTAALVPVIYNASTRAVVIDSMG